MGIALPEPKGHQRDVVSLKAEGHCVVLGTAGSGKTTMAVHRAHYLAKAPEIGGQTLLVTFNKALITYLRGISVVSPSLRIETYHRFARGYLNNRQPPVRIYKDKEQAVQRSLDALRANGSRRAVLDRPIEFFMDELHWMVGHGVTDRGSYVEDVTPRIGRGQPLQQSDREIVFEIYRDYLRQRAEAGYRYDWDDIASIVLRSLKEDSTNRRYRHIVVDEGQDFTPEMIRSLAAAIPENGSLTFFGDYAQQIYGSRMSWRSLRLTVREIARFAHNYRNSRQVAHLAQAMSAMPHFRDGVDLVEPTGFDADGPKPTVVKVADHDRQLGEAARQARALGSDRQVAVLTRTRDHEARLRSLLLSEGVSPWRLHRDLSRWPQGPGVFYGTYSSAKGLEFDSVILPLCDRATLPKPSEVLAHGQAEAAARESRQLYVAVTRARTELVLLHSSKLTTLLPDEMSDLYVRVDR
ncbi:UvrD-helicase domain-containing protein [Phytomonospora endophytica]|uniref:DNA 3'-5' helicase n=1 Tax=Phytomonospora endophytica TaxID=714109 RepID=A0A841FUI8_9ACTN|nr:UvrD-helicase domain-containing protein [Phytomonospora endophytica]MBB6036179.1 superfamily I DNA/RNA helicase [Phytomonospora endophytica]